MSQEASPGEDEQERKGNRRKDRGGKVQESPPDREAQELTVPVPALPLTAA